jgi:DNA replication protein DnaC
MARAKKATEASTDPLDAMLARLQLSGIRDQLDSLLDEAARANLSARETLILLCEREIARKDHRRIEMALKLAHFPAVKELAGFDFEAQPSIDPEQIRDLAASRWIANGENVLLLGPRGVGKTHLSVALGERRSWPDTRCSSRRRRRWSLASPRRTASGAWTRNCWRCRSPSC